MEPKQRISGDEAIRRSAQVLQVGGDQVFEIFDQCVRNNERWGGPEHDDHNGLDYWCEALQNLVPYDSDYDYRDRLVEIAALALQAIQSYDRQPPIACDVPSADVQAGQPIDNSWRVIGPKTVPEEHYRKSLGARPPGYVYGTEHPDDHRAVSQLDSEGNPVQTRSAKDGN